MRIPLALVLAAVAFGSAAAEWCRYRNDRFRTAAETPADWRMGAAPANDDGRAFSSPDGRAEIIVSGSNAALPRETEFRIRLTPGDGETVDYERRGRDWIVVSGRKGDRIFYRKSLLSCDGRVWNSVSLEYPAAEKKAFGPIVARVAASLRGGGGYGTGPCR